MYYGHQFKPAVYNSARLNLIGANALLTKLGVALEDPSVPLALTAASYQGNWDLVPLNSVAPTRTVFISPTGATDCQNRTTMTFYTCTLTVTDSATGAFTYSDSAGNTASGVASFINGTATGTYHDPSATPTDLTFTAHRR